MSHPHHFDMGDFTHAFKPPSPPGGRDPSPTLAPAPTSADLTGLWCDTTNIGLDASMDSASTDASYASYASYHLPTMPQGPPSFTPYWRTREDGHHLSHASSISSINSLLTSSTESQPGGSLLVDVAEHGTMEYLQQSPSRPQNEVSYQQGSFQTPDRSGEVGPAPSRSRSSSRPAPYLRERSTSLMSMTPLAEPKSRPTIMTRQASWSTNNSPVSPADKVALQHRRTWSNFSALSASAQPTPITTPIDSPLVSHAASFPVPGPATMGMPLPLLSESISCQQSPLAQQIRQMVGEKARSVLAIPPGSAHDKARTRFAVEWLRLSYTLTTHTDLSVPRQGMYYSYEITCKELGVREINTATFGKAVKHAFRDINTRRLGRRGDSRYHYIGLQPTTRLEASRLNEYGDSTGRFHIAIEETSPMTIPNQGCPSSNEDSFDEHDEDTDMDEDDDGETIDIHSLKRTASSDLLWPAAPQVTDHWQSTIRRPTVLAYGQPSYITPTLSNDQASMFWTAYTLHEEVLVRRLQDLDFEGYQRQTRTFWSTRSLHEVEILGHSGSLLSSVLDKTMAKSYNRYISVIAKHVFSQTSTLSAIALRAFGSSLEALFEETSIAFTPAFYEPKAELAARAGHIIQTLADLAQITAALCPILSEQAHVHAVIESWETMNSKMISDQSVLGLGCSAEVISRVFTDFARWLHDVETNPARGFRAMERLVEWMEGILQELGQSVGYQALIAKTTTLTTLVLRDFTLRSDTTFGSLQLIKTWIDDYVTVWVLRRTTLSPENLDIPIPTAPSDPMPAAAPLVQLGAPVASSLSIAIPPRFNRTPDIATAVPRILPMTNDMPVMPIPTHPMAFNEASAWLAPSPFIDKPNV